MMKSQKPWILTRDFWKLLPSYVLSYGPAFLVVALAVSLATNSTLVEAQSSAIDVSGMNIAGEDIATTAINVVNAFVPVIILVGGFGLGLYIVGRIVGLLR